MDLALNNLQRLICHKNPISQPTNLYYIIRYYYIKNVKEKLMVSFVQGMEEKVGIFLYNKQRSCKKSFWF